MSRPSSIDLDRDARHPLALREVEQREQMRVDRVHAAGADQTHEMQRAAVRLDTAGRRRRTPGW